MTKLENHKVTAIRKRSRGGDPLGAVVFLIPCLQFVQLKVIGVLNGSDLILLATFVVIALKGKIRVAEPIGKRSLILGSLWLASQCVTDIVRHTAFADYARGWSNIGLTLVNLAVLWTLLYGRPERLLLYGWGLVEGSLASLAISPNDNVPDYPWKFGFAYPVTLAVFVLASRAGSHRRWPVAPIGVIGFINFALGSRNLGGVCLAAATYLFVSRLLLKKGPAGSNLKATTIVAMAASILVSATAILWAYQYAAKSGILGEDAKQKYEEQSSGKYGVLLGGRTELLASIPAVYDSPILGHGSWAKDRIYYLGEVRALALLGYKNAMDLSREELIDGLIPAHSYLLQAWVYGGIVGALFWVWVYVLVARVLMRIYPPTVGFLPLAAFLGFSLLWDILFSPYGATTRIVVPYSIVILASCMNMASHRATVAEPAALKKRPVSTKGRARVALTPRPQQ